VASLVRGPLPLVRQSLAGFDRRLAFVQALNSLDRHSHQLAPQRQPLALGGEVLPLLGDVLALRGNPLAFPDHPAKLLRLQR
jgi:hypothetical protein